MAEDKAASQAVEVKLPIEVKSAKISDETIILISGASNLLMKEESNEDETRKVEKEVADLKVPSRAPNPESSSSAANATFLEMEEKIKEMESKRALELEKKISTLQEQLQLSQSRAEEMEQKLTSNDAIINELTEELNLHKASEDQMKADMLALEKLLSVTKEDMQTKLVNLKDVEMKLQEQVKEREAIETHLRNQELQQSNLQNDLYNLNGEKVRLQTTVADLDSRLLENEEIRSKLEAKLNLSLSYKDDLEQKLKLLEELHHESRTASEVASKRNLELEELIHASNAAEEGLREHLKETQIKLDAAEKKNMELEGELNFAETKFLDAEEQIEELSEQITELTAVLKEVDEETTLSKRQFDGYKTTIGHLESSLNKSFSRNTQLEKELNSLVHKCAEHEGFATATHQRSLELENLIRSTNSKAESAEKRVTELEKLLESAKSRTLELERLLSASEARHKNAETESKQHSSRASELLAELEAYQTRAESLEAVLQASNEREKELTDSLKVINEERKKFEQLSNIYGKKLSEAEKTVQYLQSDLRSLITQGENIEEDLQASRVREKVLLDKLKYAGEQLERRGKAVEEVTARNLDLKSQNEYLHKELELKLQEASVSFRRKESETKELRERIKSLEEERAFYKAQAVEATETVATLKDEMEANARKVLSRVSAVEVLQQKILESDVKLEQTFAENDMLARTCAKLKEELEVHHLKVGELNELLKSVYVEKEAAAEQLLVYKERARESAALEENQKGNLENALVKLQELEALVEELEIKSEKYRTDAEGLAKENTDLSRELAAYEEQVHESAALVANQKEKLEDALLRLQDLEGLVDQWQKKSDQLKTENKDLAREHLSLSQDLANYERKTMELQIAFNAVVAEREDKSTQMHSLREEMDDLMQQLTSDNKILQSQITTVVEDNNMLNEMCQKARNELEATLVHLEEKVSEGKEREISLITNVSSLQMELSEKPFMQARISELEQKLLQAEKTYAEEIESARAVAVEKEAALNENLKQHSIILQERDDLEQHLNEIIDELEISQRKVLEQKKLVSMKDLERQTSMKQSLGELETERRLVTILELQIEELEHKLQDAEIQYKEKVIEESVKCSRLNEELNELRQKLSEAVEMEKKIQELETTLVHLEEKVSEGKEREISLTTNVSSLQTELAEKQFMQARISELEQKLLESERTYAEEIESVRAVAVEKEAALNENLKQHSIILQERDALEQHLNEIRDELEISQRKVLQQKKLVSMKELERQTSMRQSLGELETERQLVTLLELQIEELEQKLQDAEIQYKEKAIEGSAKHSRLNEELNEARQKLSGTVEMEKKIQELEIKLQQTHAREQKSNDDLLQAHTEDSMEVKSRELGMDVSVLSNTRRNKITAGLHQAPEITSVHPITQAGSEPSAAMALRFILGVAFVSMIVGIILGKRY